MSISRAKGLNLLVSLFSYRTFKLRNAMAHFAKELIVLLICSALHAGQSAKILALLNVASPSHNFFNMALAIALAERGHQVLYFVVFGSE